MKKVSLKKAIEILGGTNIELKAGYYYCSGFFDMNGQTYYVSTSDIRVCPLNNSNSIMYRVVRDRKDFIGGVNLWDFKNKLADKGYEVGSCRVKTN